MNVRSKVIRKIKRKVSLRAALDYKNKITIKPPASGLAMMNNRCHYNAVNAVKTGIAIAVVEVVIIGDDDCTAHYINLLQNGDHVDLTLGWAWGGCDYRLVRYVHENEYSKINEKLSALKSKLTRDFIGSG